MIFFKNKKNTSAKELQSLQSRLEALRQTIQEKRQKAQRAFDKLLEAIEKTKGIEGLEHLSDQLAELGQIFTAGKETLKAHPEKEIIAFQKTDAELALEDIFAAMESLARSKERKDSIKAAMLKEELKHMMLARYANSRNHPGDWTKTVTSNDLVELLQKSSVRVMSQHFESPQVFLEQSLHLAQETVSLRDLKAFMPNQASDAKGLNNAPTSKGQQQGV